MLGKKRSYKDLIVWQKADMLYHMVADDIEKFPRMRVADLLIRQLIDSVGSISTNIAEGYGRGGSREFRQYFRNSRGSLMETDNWLFKAMKRGFITSQRYKQYLQLEDEIGKMITSFIGRLNIQIKENKTK